MLAVGKARREEILDAARREFSARGYGGATIDAIAVDSGIDLWRAQSRIE